MAAASGVVDGSPVCGLTLMSFVPSAITSTSGVIPIRLDWFHRWRYEKFTVAPIHPVT